MASLKASPVAPISLKSLTHHATTTKQRRLTYKSSHQHNSVFRGAKLNSCNSVKSVRCSNIVCSSTAREASVLQKDEEVVETVSKEKDGYLVKEFGWGVRRMAKVGEEIRKVAYVQAEAFHEPVVALPFVNDLLFDFFRAEVLSALMYRLRSSAPNRYACLVAESITSPKSPDRDIAGVLDATILRDAELSGHIPEGEEYLYVSGIAVLKKFRRQKVATTMLKACDVLSMLWGIEYLVLRAHEDDSAARRLYSNAGYRVVSRDPFWVTWMGKRRRVLMLKKLSSKTSLHTKTDIFLSKI